MSEQVEAPSRARAVSIGAAVVALLALPPGVWHRPGAETVWWPLVDLADPLLGVACAAALASLGAAIAARRAAGCTAWASWLVVAWTLGCAGLVSLDSTAGLPLAPEARTLGVRDGVTWRMAPAPLDSVSGVALYACAPPFLCRRCARSASPYVLGPDDPVPTEHGRPVRCGP